MAVTLDQFAQRLAAAGLMAADELQHFTASLPPGDAPRDAQTLARQLIQAGRLTKYQAAAIYKGEIKGLVLGNYVILDKLGEGGMGEVYRARHRVMEREVALKVLPAKMLDSPDAVKRFHREVKAAARLEHPNIVIAFDADQAAGQHFLVMQFVDGHDLSDLVKQHGPMRIEEAIDCCTQAARGLAYAHAQGVIHRDIKPSNLLLDKTGTVKILDMGLARLAEQADDEQSGLGSLTQSGQIMGTVDYMAPEQAENTRQADHRADIYSLGCTLYVLLTAKAPFQGATVLQKMMAHQQKPAPKLSDARGDASLLLDSVLARMLAKNPDERYQSMDEVIVALQSCLAPEQAHAAGALAAGSSDSHLTAFLDNLAASENRGAATRESTAAGKHEETFNKQPEVDDTGTGITRPPIVSADEPAKPQAATPSVAASRRKRLLLPALLTGGGVLCFALLAGVLSLLLWLPWQAGSPVVNHGDAIVDSGPAPPLAVAPFDEAAAKNHQKAWAAYLGASVEKEIDLPGGAKLTMVLIPPGEFLMGSTDEEQARFLDEAKTAKNPSAIAQIPSEGPQHRVQITHPFYLGKHELTQRQWESVMGANPSLYKDSPLKPVERVSWEDVQSYVAKLNEAPPAGMMFALPTEAQWEYAGRAGTATPWHCDDGATTLLEYGRSRENSPHTTVDVGTRRPNAFGLFDMYGNVSEWCADWFSANYYLGSPLQDPTGPETGSRRVFRGGAWKNSAEDCRSAYRDHGAPASSDYARGFRLAMSIDTAMLANVAQFDGDSATPYQILTSADYQWTEPENMGPEVNSPDSDTSGALSAGGLTLLVQSNRAGGAGGNDLWMCVRSTPQAAWSPARNLGPIINSSANDEGPSISADGLTLMFSSDRNQTPGKHRLWASSRQTSTSPWSAPALVSFSGNAAGANDHDPELSADGRQLLFHSPRLGGQGGDDLWEIRRQQPGGPWGTPRNLGPNINSGSREICPTLSSDGRVLLFSSDRPGGLGRLDLWMSTRASPDAPWTTPAPLGAPVNTSDSDELSPTLSADGRTLIFRGRAASNGKPDLRMSRRVRKASVDADDRWLNLLPLIDPTADAVKGPWKFNDSGELFSDATTGARIGIPYRPPAEYDVRVVFTKTAGNDCLTQYLVGGERQFLYRLGGRGNTIVAFDKVDDQPDDSNPSTVKRAAWLERGRRYESMVQIRQDGVRAFLDGQLVTQLQTDFHNVDISETWRLNETGILGLGTYDTPTLYHRVEVREISGHGAFTRPDDPAAKSAAASRIAAAPPPKLSARLQAALPDSSAGHIALSPDGKLLAGRNSATKKIKLWDLPTRKLKFTWDADGYDRAMAFMASAGPLAAGENNSLVSFNTVSGQRGSASALQGGTPKFLAFASDGRYMAIGRGLGDASVELRDLKSRDPSKTLARHGTGDSDTATCVAFSSDGTRLASGGLDRRVRIYDVAAAKELLALDAVKMVHAVAFSPDGRLLASGDRGPHPDGKDHGSVKLWDAATGQQMREFTGFDYIVGDVAFSPDGRLLAASQEHGGPAYVFDLLSGGDPLVIDEANAWSVEFLPTGHTLITAGEKTGVQIWDIDVPEVEITTATFTAPDQDRGIKPVGTDGKTFQVVEIDGKSAIQPVLPESKGLFFAVDDAFAFDLPEDSTDRIVLQATVLSPEADAFSFTVGFDSHQPNNESAHVIQPFTTVKGTGKWIDLEWELPHARLANRLTDGGDLMLHFYSRPVHEVTLTRIRSQPKANHAVEFDGQSSRVEIPTWNYDGKTPLTFECRVTPPTVITDDISNVQTLLADGYGQGVRLNLRGNGKLEFFVGTGPAAHSDNATIVPNRAMHVAAVYDGEQSHLYVDGKRQVSKPVSKPISLSQRGLLIGANQKDGVADAFFHGVLDEIRISSTARYTADFTPPEQHTRFTPDKDTIALYHCDDGFGNVLTDSSGNGHHGRIVRAKWAAMSDQATFTNALGMQFIRIPAGKSWLGGGGGKPGTRKVEFKDDFYLGKFEVTQREWERLMGNNPCTFSRGGGRRDVVKDLPDVELKRLPVESVSWEDAQQFIAKLNDETKDSGWVYRLPTQDEWEYACRGGPMSQQADSLFDFYLDKPSFQGLAHGQANFGMNLKRPAAVGSYPPNRLGLFDMHGNVCEWCADEVKGSDGISHRVNRGGSWSRNGFGDCRAASSLAFIPSTRYNDLGLRLARVPVAGSWQSLFNGKDLTGWAYTSTSLKEAEVRDDDGQPALRLKKGVYLGTRELGDYQLRFEYKAQADASGGIHLFGHFGGRLQLTLADLKRPSLSAVAYTFEQAEFQGGQLVSVGQNFGGKGEDGVLRLSPAPLNAASPWQRVEICRLGDAFVFLVNGRLAGAVDNVRHQTQNEERIPGPSGVTFWASAGPASFRNIEVREINALPPEIVELAAWQPLFNGKDTTGWTKTHEGNAIVAMEDGQPTLRLTEPVTLSRPIVGDYHLRFEYKPSSGEYGGGLHMIGLPNRSFSLGLGDLKNLNVYGKGCISQPAKIQTGRFVSLGQSLADKTPFRLTNYALNETTPWQQFEVIRQGDSFAILINGKIAGAFTHVRLLRDGNEEMPAASVPLMFWAFGGPGHFRNIEIREINALPPEIVASSSR